MLLGLFFTLLPCVLCKEPFIVSWNLLRDEVEKSCIILPPINLPKLTDKIISLYVDDAPVFAYNSESIVKLKSTDDLEISFSLEGKSLSTVDLEKLNPKPLLVIDRKSVDRTCLLSVSNEDKLSLTAHAFIVGDQDMNKLISWINERCFLFRNINGSLNKRGIHQKYILENLYHSPDEKENYQQSHCEERFDLPTSREFFTQYVQHNKPVIFRNASKEWPAMTKWSNKFFEENYGNRRVHIKLAPNGQFEGVDSVNNWEDFRSGKFSIPISVLKKLAFPDLVVVRPATLDIKMSEFLHYISNQSSELYNVSVYLEYASLGDIGEELVQRDIQNPEFAKSLLTTRHVNIWLSDGRTVGKLHFDQFDNLLCQLSGSKELSLYDPHDNTRLYESHIPEALLTYNRSSREFYRRKLLDSTSMVMSPIDITNPDLKRFPAFASLRPLKCRINPGDILYLPSFWWHEVQSSPSETEKRNLAVNFWYEPFLSKSFPCDSCSLDVNPYYTHLL